MTSLPKVPARVSGENTERTSEAEDEEESMRMPESDTAEVEAVAAADRFPKDIMRPDEIAKDIVRLGRSWRLIRGGGLRFEFVRRLQSANEPLFKAPIAIRAGTSDSALPGGVDRLVDPRKVEADRNADVLEALQDRPAAAGRRPGTLARRERSK